MTPELPTLFEDQDLLILNKPSGLLSEGADEGNSCVESLASHSLGKDVRCCHRLDRLTSGVILLRKNKRFTREIAKIIENHCIRKTYWAVTRGIWPRAMNRIENQLSHRAGRTVAVPEGKPALSTVRVLVHDTAKEYSLIELLLKTGRTHQARVHCADTGHPVIGDPLYGAGESGGFFGLHARELKFKHPGSGENITIVAAPPSSWEPYLVHLGSRIIKKTRPDPL